MSTIVTRAGKGSELTYDEMDANLNNLNNDKVESVEGTAVLSTGEGAGTKVLTEDGAGGSSWEAVAGAGLGDVTKVGTPVNDQVGVWTGDGTIEGTTGFTYDGSTMDVTGAITVSSTVDGRDLATDGTKLDGIEALAEVTSTAKVTSAGALMDSELTSIADVKALNQSVVSGAAPVFAATNMTDGTDKNFISDAEAVVLGNTSGTNAGDVTLAGTPDYITLAGQVLTRNQIVLTTDVSGVLPIANIATGTPDGTKYVKDDGTLDTPAGGGGISNVVEDTTPQLGGMLDVNANAIGDGTLELLTFTEDVSAVNHVNIENEATGSGPIISAVGDDANVDLIINGKGTGNISLGNFTFNADQTIGAGQDNYVVTYDDATELLNLEVAPGAGGGITSLESQTGATQTFADDTNVTMVSAADVHTITWAGTLADGRITSAATWNAKQDALTFGIADGNTPDIDVGASIANLDYAKWSTTGLIGQTYAQVRTDLNVADGADVGDLLADGTVPLTSNWDVGAFTITGTQFISDIVTGTAPLVVASTTEVANLKAATVGTITGLAPDTATTQATQAGITTCTNLVTVGALGSGSISAGFGAIDNGTSNITTGGILALDVDGTATAAAGSLTLGAGSDASVFFNGTHLEINITGGVAGTPVGYQITQEYTAGENVADGDLCYLKEADSKYWKANAVTASSAESKQKLAIAMATINADAAGKFLTQGIYVTTGLTAGLTYVGETDGTVTATAPSTSGDTVRIIGQAESTTHLHFNPDHTYIEV